MPNWAEILNEINRAHADPNIGDNALDVIRRKYLLALHAYTGRNIIAYYSAWLNRGNCFGTDINDMDMNGFMNAINGLDCAKGLDLILHTPGGSISATEHLVQYLKSKFGTNIRAVVPQLAMSAGTMIACSCKEIVMGKQSCLGPFDPQYNGYSAMRVEMEFDNAIKAAKKDPASIPFWREIIGKYNPTFLDSCKLVCQRSKSIVKKWLLANMFKDSNNAISTADAIIEYFTETGKIYDHDKHININQCEKAGLKIIKLEDDQTLQDLILTVHHAFIQTLSCTNFTKAIENHIGIARFTA